jgi:hypothetical protein
MSHSLPVLVLPRRLVLATLVGVPCWCLAPAVMADGADDIRWNGFLNVVGGRLKDPPGNSPGSASGYTDQFTFDAETSAGLQATKPLDDEMSVTAQVFARGADDNYAATMKWLYLSWQPGENSLLRIGRVGTPLYFYSDYLNVGYAYHWVRPPQEVYSYDTTLTGINYSYQTYAGAWDLSPEVFIGTEKQYLAPLQTTVDSRNAGGIILTAGYDGWLTLRGMQFRQDCTFTFDNFSSDTVLDEAFGGIVDRQLVNQAQADGLRATYEPAMRPLIDEVMVIEDQTITYREFALRMEHERWFVMSEWVKFKTDTYLLGDPESMYVSAGYRMGDFLMHLTRGHYTQGVSSEVKADNVLLQQVLAADSALDLVSFTGADLGRALRAAPAVSYSNVLDSTSVGVAWDVSLNMVLKADLGYAEAHPPIEGDTGGQNWHLRVAANVTF